MKARRKHGVFLTNFASRPVVGSSIRNVGFLALAVYGTVSFRLVAQNAIKFALSRSLCK